MKTFSVLVALVAWLAAGSHAVPAAKEPALLLFGDRDHKKFLGCLNCSRYDDGSVCNRYGDYGSRYADASIWNRYGDYGSRYSDTSPWNRYASNPPIIVDDDGRSYGYFTANRTHDNRTAIPALRSYVDNVDDVLADLQAARDSFCG